MEGGRGRGEWKKVEEVEGGEGEEGVIKGGLSYLSSSSTPADVREI